MQQLDALLKTITEEGCNAVRLVDLLKHVAKLRKALTPLVVLRVGMGVGAGMTIQHGDEHYAITPDDLDEALDAFDMPIDPNDLIHLHLLNANLEPAVAPVPYDPRVHPNAKDGHGE